MRELVVSNWAYINAEQVVLNGEQKRAFNQDESIDQKLEALYRALGVAYPKFFKMDAQSKLGWLCAEYLSLGGTLFDGVAKEDVALVLSNQQASLETDEHYWKSLQEEEEFLPSPAVFVYTLPNIVAGEICIRHGLKGENNFFIHENFDPQTLIDYTQALFSEDLCKLALVGWVEVYHGAFKALLFSVVAKEEDRTKEYLSFESENLKSIYIKSEL